MNNKVALIFIFNHKFDKNIEVLEKIYKERFSNIYHLVPFYKGDKPNVIPVYENSQHFQGYISQGLKAYFNENYEHYFFIGDDLILNPAINENNYKEYFGLSDKACFIPEIHNLHHLANNDTLRFLPVKSIQGSTKKWYWCKIKEFVENYKHGYKGVENSNEMPTAKEAEAILKSKGYEAKPVNYFDLYGGLLPLSSASVTFVSNMKSYFKKVKLSYPVVGSYSDIIIVSKHAIKNFSHYCGVFATNKLFVEFAIPTALLLAADEVVTEPILGKRGEIYWLYTAEELKNYEDKMKPYKKDLQTLLAQFPKDKIYIHPIKLSKWQTATT